MRTRTEPLSGGETEDGFITDIGLTHAT